MDNNKIRVAITHGDINGVGYEVILKTFAEPTMFDICIPILYGSPKALTFHKKQLELDNSYHIIHSAAEAQEGVLNVVTAYEEDVKIELGMVSYESGQAALMALEMAMNEYANGLIDVLVTAPINKESIQSKAFHFVGHTEYLASKVGGEPLMILMNNLMRVALVTTHLPITAVPAAITGSAIEDKIRILHGSLVRDFCISQPRIAVLALNPHAGEGGVIGDEEEAIVKPVINKMVAQGIQCFGPYAADGFFGAAMYQHFDAVLAMYHDQGLAPFKALSMTDGVNYTAGIPIIRTSPDHGTAFNIAGKGVADENSFRQAIYSAIDIYHNRKMTDEASANPLRKTYKDRREDNIGGNTKAE